MPMLTTTVLSSATTITGTEAAPIRAIPRIVMMRQHDALDTDFFKFPPWG
jgi:hypothetical protein